MKKVLWFIFIPLATLLILLSLFLWYKNEPLPAGKPGPEAEAMAKKMLEAIDYTAWDTTRRVQWTFRGSNHYDWNKETDVVEVKWDDIRVMLRTKETAGEVFKAGKAIEGEQAQEYVQKAWSMFANDSFWLNAPAKVFDPGTTRAIVEVADGRKGLMVTYTTGGVTPGDSYVWFLDDQDLPSSFKMWVSILPVGGLEFSWENWTTLETGARIAQNHEGSILSVPITNLKAQ